MQLNGDENIHEYDIFSNCDIITLFSTLNLMMAFPLIEQQICFDKQLSSYGISNRILVLILKTLEKLFITHKKGLLWEQLA